MFTAFKRNTVSSRERNYLTRNGFILFTPEGTKYIYTGKHPLNYLFLFAPDSDVIRIYVNGQYRSEFKCHSVNAGKGSTRYFLKNVYDWIREDNDK